MLCNLHSNLKKFAVPPKVAFYPNKKWKQASILPHTKMDPV